jgi:hypothetical protein
VGRMLTGMKKRLVHAANLVVAHIGGSLRVEKSVFRYAKEYHGPARRNGGADGSA